MSPRPARERLTVTGLFVHPVKSSAIRPVQRTWVEPRGFSDDRSWLVVDASGVMLTARTVQELFRIVADTPRTCGDVDVSLRLRADGLEDLAVRLPQGPDVPVRVHSNDLQGVDAGHEAAAWIGAALGRDDVRLLWCRDPAARRLNPAHSHPGDHTAYADGYPVTVATEASLRQLNDWILETALSLGEEPAPPLGIDRFRANLVLDGDLPFDEDTWTGLRIGDVHLRVATPTDRCVMTTVDPVTLARGKEPIRTLARHRRPARDTLFAVNLVPATEGTVAVGDEVEVLRD